jgi:DNA-binding MarR family transcriptional regulator
MHEMSFRLKRAHLKAVQFHKTLTKQFNLTPARFDAMYVLRINGGTCRQRVIWETLGLSPSTICKMLNAMEDAGLVWRETNEEDKRACIVHLTKFGLECVVAAMKLFLRVDALRNFYDAMHPDGRDFIKMCAGWVDHIARKLRDWSTLSYAHDPPRPDEIAGLDRANAEVEASVVEQEKRRLALWRSTPGWYHYVEEDGERLLFPSRASGAPRLCAAPRASGA